MPKKILPGNKVQMTIYLDKDLAALAMAAAKDDSRTFNSFAVRSITDRLDRLGYALTIQESGATSTTTTKKG